MPVRRLGAVTAESYYPLAGEDRGGRVVRTVADFAAFGPLAKVAARKRVELPGVDEVSEAAAVPALLHGDRWLVKCPDCAEYQLAWTRELLFMCSSCWNADVGGLWRRVEMPADRDEIETEVGKRTHPKERNWLPGESVAELRAENVDLRAKGRAR